MHDFREHGVISRQPLHQMNHVPQTLLGVSACDLWRLIPGPTLFHVPGRKKKPLFASVLLHGNENTGWLAFQRVLKNFDGKSLPRSLLLFVANIDAAKANVRTLPHQADYNRSWPGTNDEATAEAKLMRQVFDVVRQQEPFASIDIHNNTGRNPHYACVNRLDTDHLQLARLFSRTVVYFDRPIGVQSAAMAKICPSVTVECGLAGEAGGVEHAAEFIASALNLDQIPERGNELFLDLELMRTFAILNIPAGASMSFDGSDADFCFRHDLDKLNFSQIEPGSVLGTLGKSGRFRVEVIAEASPDCSCSYLTYDEGTITLTRRATPAMLTRDVKAIRLDCLGYLMHRIGRDGIEIDT